MASKRQAEANRRNARKSTGPRSSAGKKRARRNAHRHGLSISIVSSAEFAKRIETLAHKMAGAGADAVTLDLARSVAEAEFDLARIRRTKAGLIAQMSAFGEIDRPSEMDEWRRMNEAIRVAIKGVKRGEPFPDPLIRPPPPEMPSSEPERTAEAVRRALTELLQLSRYEKRAAARRDRATRHIIARMPSMGR